MFDLEIHGKKRIENRVAYHLSRMRIDVEHLIDDSLAKENAKRTSRCPGTTLYRR